jgi:uncharacterized membrane protein YhaH (DUF805 family)
MRLAWGDGIVTFNDAWRTVLLQKYATFSGRARRSEFWWYALFQFGVMVAASIIDGVLFRGHQFVSGLAALALIVPNVAVSVRRLHDTNRSGWWYLLVFIPVLGGLVLLYFVILPGAPATNSYGPNPAPGEGAFAA